MLATWTRSWPGRCPLDEASDERHKHDVLCPFPHVISFFYVDHYSEICLNSWCVKESATGPRRDQRSQIIACTVIEIEKSKAEFPVRSESK